MENGEWGPVTGTGTRTGVEGMSLLPWILIVISKHNTTSLPIGILNLAKMFSR